MSIVKTICFGLFLTSAGGASAATIDFEEFGESILGNGLEIQGATFNSLASDEPQLRTIERGDARTTFIGAFGREGRFFSGLQSLEIIFSTSISSLAFSVVSDDLPGNSSTIEFFSASGRFVENLAVSGNGLVKDDMYFFGGLNAVTRVVITPNDPVGLGYDDFVFEKSDTITPVPLPASLPFLIASILGLGFVRRL